MLIFRKTIALQKQKFAVRAAFKRSRSEAELADKRSHLEGELLLAKQRAKQSVAERPPMTIANCKWGAIVNDNLIMVFSGGVYAFLKVPISPKPAPVSQSQRHKPK